MRTSVLAAAFWIAVIPAGAQSSMTETIGGGVNRSSHVPDLITCWYSENGEFTGAETAAAGAKAGATVQAAASGERSWSYTLPGHDSAVCPSKLPVSSGANS